MKMFSRIAVAQTLSTCCVCVAIFFYIKANKTTTTAPTTATTTMTITATKMRLMATIIRCTAWPWWPILIWPFRNRPRIQKRHADGLVYGRSNRWFVSF